MSKWLILAIVATCAIYSPIRGAPLVFEDHVYVRAASHPTTTKSLLQPRGLTILTMRWNRLLVPSADTPSAYHLANLFLHGVVGLAVYGLGAAIVGPQLALVGAALFLIHPLNSEAGDYVAGRAELIMAAGIVLAVWAAVSGHNFLALIATIVAVGGKELGVMAIPLCILTVAMFKGVRRNMLVAGVVFIALVIAVIQLRMVDNVYLLTSQKSGIEYMAVQSWALWQMLGLFVWPAGLSLDHDMELLTTAGTLVALAVGLMVVVWAFLLRRAVPVFSWAVAWVVISLLPRFFVRIPEYLNEHQMYTPMIGLCLAAPVVVKGVYEYVARCGRYIFGHDRLVSADAG